MDKGRSTKVLQLLQDKSPFVPGRSQAASIPKQNRRFHPETPTGLKSTREYFYPSRMIDNKTSGRNPILKDLLYLIVCGGLFAAAWSLDISRRLSRVKS